MRWSAHLVRTSFHSKMCLLDSRLAEELEQLGLEQLGLEQLGLEQLGLEQLGLVRHFFHRRLGLCHRYKGQLERWALLCLLSR